MHESKGLVGAEEQSDELVWKVLVYDRHGRDIISPLFTVPELRDTGVTLHLCD